MKFGKRLAAEASRRWHSFYLDYKALKRALQDDVDIHDASGAAFACVLRQELQKISAFYVEKEEELQAIMQGLQGKPAADLSAFRAEVHDLKKYVVLNYIAVIKAIKKRNRHLQVIDRNVPVLRAVDVLTQQYFFTSPRLAALATQAEVLQLQCQAADQTPSEVLQSYQCPICLGVLRTPVVLTCDHRFCWGCIIAHCAAVAAAHGHEATMGPFQGSLGNMDQDTQTDSMASSSSTSWMADSAAADTGKATDGRKEARAVAPFVLVSDDDSAPAPALTFDCPTCRRPHLMDVDKLQVDPHLSAYIEQLQRKQQQTQQTASSTSSHLVIRSQAPTTAAPAASTPVSIPTSRMSSAYQAQAPAQHTPRNTTDASYMADDERAEEGEDEHDADQELLFSTATSTPSDQSLLASAAAEAVAPMAVDAAPCGAPDTTVQVPVAKASAPVQQLQQVSTSRQARAEDATPAVPEASSVAASKAMYGVGAGKPPLAPTSRSFSAGTFIHQADQQPVAAGSISAAPSPPTPPLASSCEAASAAPSVVSVKVPGHEAGATAEPPLLPPQAARFAGKLTVVLDLDGTLVSSFTPRRAPCLPPGAIGYVVGKGGKLNPQGVFVVERPGLREFFQRVCAISEVVLFTAGLEDYAKPIVDALESRYGRIFSARLYRPATRNCEVYPCIKDLSRLGRDLKRTLLVDDTPLAFLGQPNNGIPVLAFKSDPDDRILLEAVAPMLEGLASVPDIRPLLHTKFNMPRWFKLQGLPCPDNDSGHTTEAEAGLSAPPSPRLPRKAASDSNLLRQQGPQGAPQALLAEPPCSRVLLLLDFDKTLTDFDAGERLVAELAPELVPMLASLDMPANFIPITNTVLAEMQRRGVSRDKLLSTLRNMGQELPAASVSMLRWAAARNVDVRVLSDCNSVFISHMIQAAKAQSYVREVITNTATFERAPCAPDGVTDVHLQRSMEGAWAASISPRPSSCAHRLVIHPRHPYQVTSHGCELCPENLCKGAELRRVREASRTGSSPHGYARIIYCGDGANDMCPALQLGPQDVVLPRRGHSLEKLIQQRQAGEGPDSRQVRAKMAAWSTHEQLFALVQQAINAVPM